MNAELLITLLLGLVDRAAAISALLSQAKAQNRDITDAEIRALMQDDDVARSALVTAIAKARVVSPTPPTINVAAGS